MSCPDCLLNLVSIESLEDILVNISLDTMGGGERISPVTLDLLLPGCNHHLVDLALDEFNGLINGSHLPGDVVLFCLEGFLLILLGFQPSTQEVNALCSEEFLETGDLLLHLFGFLCDLTLILHVGFFKGNCCLVKSCQDLIHFFVVHCIKDLKVYC